MSRQPQILVLEDDDDMREVLTQVLQDQGYQVVSVAAGAEAVEKAATQTFDLIVADIRMPGMDGLQAVELTKQQQPQIGAMIVSGYSSPEETRRAAELQVGAYLKKPFRMKKFLRLVQEQLRHVQRADQAQTSRDLREEAMYWGLETLLRVADANSLTAPAGSLARAGELAGQMSAAMGYDPGVTRELRLAAQFALLKGLDGTDPPDWLLTEADLLPSFSQAVTAPDSTEGQLVRLCVLVGPEADRPSPESLAGKVSDELLEVYAALDTEASPDRPRAPRNNHTLLALAQTLTRSGDRQSAAEAYRTLAERTQDQQMAIRARLELARLCPEQAEGLLAEAVEGAARLGPAQGARALLEIAVARQATGSPPGAASFASGAEELFLQVAGEAERLGLPGLEGLARVALQKGGRSQERLEFCLQHLLDPADTDQFLAHADWLLPQLLHLELSDSTFQRLVTRFPEPLPAALGSAPEGVRERLLSLAESGSLLADPLLRALAGDTNPEIRARAVALKEGERGAPVAPLLRVHSFGDLEVFRGSEAVEPKSWKTRKTRYLFALLASDWGKGFSEDYLLDTFWPESGEKGQKNLYWALSVARRCLKSEQPEPDIVVREQGRLRLTREIPHWHDVQEFLAAAEAIRRARSEEKGGEALNQLGRLVRLYRGPYLEDCYLDWAVRLRDELERTAAESFCELAELLLEQQMAEGAIEAGAAAVRVAPYRQQGHLVLMRAFIQAGRPAEAVRQYQRCEELLRRDYRMDPGTELMRCKLEAELAC